MGWFNKIKENVVNNFTTKAVRETDADVFKAFIPNFLYKPPYGYPRNVNTVALRMLAKNSYIFSVVKTLCDEATTIKWEVKVKEEYQVEQEAMEEDPSLEADDISEIEEEPVVDPKKIEGKSKPDQYQKDIDKITKFFKNPNRNNESFEHILRSVITDILEVDAGVIIKVFNKGGEMSQIFARDGSTFLKNPDIYGYMGDRAQFVPPLPMGYESVNINFGQTADVTQQNLIKHYDMLYREKAGYFQYGWTASSMPVPFGQREVVYMMHNPRTDSIYGRSPIEVLSEVILNLVYGTQFNLDFYTNNNMPEGVIQLLGAQQAHIQQFRENFEAQFKFVDDMGNKRKRFYSYPITSAEVKFTPFQLSSKDMEVIAQQEWFTKIMWMCFGVNADEMGYTESSNRAVGAEQIRTFKRKAIKPLLDLIAYNINTQILPEFYVKNKEENLEDVECPLYFEFDTYDIEEDLKEHTLYEQQIRMGIKTPMMVAKEMGIDVEELKAEKDQAMRDQQAMMQQQFGSQGGNQNVPANNNFNNQDKKVDPKEDQSDQKKDPQEDEEEVSGVSAYSDMKAHYIKREGQPKNYRYWYDQPKGETEPKTADEPANEEPKSDEQPKEEEKKPGSPGFRAGPDKYVNQSEMVSSARFDLSKTEVISRGGSDRAVFRLPDGNVIKIAKNPRGLLQNDTEGDGFLGLVPETLEVGKDYVIVPDIERDDKKSNEMLKDLKKFSMSDWDKKTSELQDALNKLDEKYDYGDRGGFADAMNYDLMWNDFISARNWGWKDGKPYHIDAGTFNKGSLDKSSIESAKGDWATVVNERAKSRREGATVISKAEQSQKQITRDAEKEVINTIDEHIDNVQKALLHIVDGLGIEKNGR